MWKMTDAAASTPVSQEVCVGHTVHFVFSIFSSALNGGYSTSGSKHWEKMHVCVITDWVIYIPDILNDKPQVILLSKMDLDHSANKHFLPVTSHRHCLRHPAPSAITKYFFIILCICDINWHSKKQYTENKHIFLDLCVWQSLEIVKKNSVLGNNEFLKTRNLFTLQYHYVSWC